MKMAKKQMLIGVAFVLIAACSTFMAKTVIAACTQCWTLEEGRCTAEENCVAHCSPTCGNTTGKVGYLVDLLVPVSSGMYSYGTQGTEDCYLEWDCMVGTMTCSFDEAQKQCTAEQGGTATYSHDKKVIWGAGCGAT